MNIRAPLIVSLSLLAGMIAASTAALHMLPADDQIAVHFDMNGAPDGFVSPRMALFTTPAIAAFAILVLTLAPRFEKRRENLSASARAYATVWVTVMALLAAGHGFIIARAFGIEISVVHGMMAGIGLLLIAIGNVAGKLKPNGTIGIRTPWTLADSANWAKTHRLYGWMSVTAGLLVIALSALVASSALVAVTGIAAVGVTSLTAVAYSFWLSRNAAPH